MTFKLEVDGLSVNYDRIRAVRDVSLTVEGGEVVGILGPNGAGKSSLLRVISGLAQPSSGAISFDGESITGRKPEEIARLGLSVVPEGRRIFRRLTVLQNIHLGASVRGRNDDVVADVDRQFERFPILAKKKNDTAASLSGGQQQQLAIARALMARPRLMILDEPSLGLDPKMVQLVFEIMAELREEGLSLLLAEQNALRTAAIADRVYVLRTGSCVWQGKSDDLKREVDYAAEYLGADSHGGAR